MALLYPSFLLALVAVAVPIVLHLVQLRRAKRVQFSNVRFIQVSKDLTASQRNLKQLLILLCRILFIVFLVLAFAQPFLPALDKFSGAGSSDVSLWVDNSNSMQNSFAAQDVPLLAVAQERANAVMNLFPASASFSLQTPDKPLATVRQKSEVAAALDALTYSGRGSANSLPHKISESTFFVFSDFQRSTFSNKFFNALDSSVSIHLVPLQGAQVSNISIDSVYLEDQFIRAGSENLLHVRLTNNGLDEVQAVPVRLSIENSQVAVLSIDVPGNQSVEATMSFRISGESTKKASVSVDDYPVEFDNTYYFTLAPSGNISVVEVTDDKGSALPAVYQREPAFKFQEYLSSQVNYGQLNEADVVILNGVKSISAALAATVANYVKAGGTLVFIPAPGAEATSYTTFFQTLTIPASLAAANLQNSKTSIAPPERNNPFFKSIFSNFDAKMQMPSSVRSVIWSRASADILKFRGGSPYLSRFDRGNGQVYMLAAPLDADKNTLSSHALFLPIMYKLAIADYKQDKALAYTLSNITIQLPAVAKPKKDGVYSLKKDSIAFVPEQQVRGNKLFLQVPAEMSEAGFYDLQLKDSTLATLAFNYSRTESKLVQYSPEELRQMVGEGHPNVHVYDYGDAFAVKADFEKQFFGVKLWKYCLILCLFFLIAEIALIRLL